VGRFLVVNCVFISLRNNVPVVLLKIVIRASRAHRSCERSLFTLIIHATLAFQYETTFLWGVAHALRSNCDFGQFDVVSRMLSIHGLDVAFQQLSNSVLSDEIRIEIRAFGPCERSRIW
jgi:hypothetical protein